MFKKILIANRGEIACRVIETAHQMGIQCVAVYSEADANARHVAMADEAYLIGPAASKDSYLRYEKIIEVAKLTGAEGIHPGYGFLSENPEFAKACAEANIEFIGPPVGAIEAMGSKSAAKAIMEKASVPLVPGYHGDNQDPAYLQSEAERIGYPVLLKAAFGGGGKGMRIVWNSEEFDEALASAKREATAGFGNDTMLLEKYLTQPRHVEIQVFADKHGNAVYLAERDCSIQRRHQKIVEEAPAPGLADEIRVAMGEAAVRAAQAIDYVGAGTVEFLYDIDGSFYFMEMNTRLQVEHPVTEMITNLDLVQWQLMVASGEELPLEQSDVEIEGHAIEVRVYAEDPDNDFLPATGQLNYLRQPEQSEYVRVDTGVRQGDEVSAFYDPMISKLIVWDEDRDLAIQRMINALADYHIAGVTTNLEFLTKLLSHQAFKNTELETQFITKHDESLNAEDDRDNELAMAMTATFALLQQRQQSKAAAQHSVQPNSPWNTADAWAMNAPATQTITLIDKAGDTQLVQATNVGSGFSIQAGEQRFEIVAVLNDDQLRLAIDGAQRTVHVSKTGELISLFDGAVQFEFTHHIGTEHAGEHEDEAGGLTAPMNGTVVAINVAAGDSVAKGQTILVMEAMKMEYAISAPADGTVEEIFYAVGDLVADGAELVNFNAAE